MRTTPPFFPTNNGTVIMVFIVLYKLSDRYYEIVKKTTVNVIGQKDDTINVQLSNINKLTERQIVIYNSIKESV